MKRRLFNTILLITVVVFLLTSGAIIGGLFHGSALTAYFAEGSTRTQLILELMPTLLAVLIIALLLGVIMTFLSVRNLSEPINGINLENPVVPEGYQEMEPLVDRIRQQNFTISMQLEQLKARQIEFDALTEKMEEGFILIGSKGDILSFNQSARRIFDKEDLEVGEPVADLNNSLKFLSIVRNALAGRHGETQIDIEDRTFQVIVNPVMDAQQCVGAVLLVLDITEREQREFLRREFTANVSHELKTPLTSIAGSAELMMSGLVGMEQVREFSGIIYDESQRLIRLIEDIINLSRLDEDDFAHEKERVDLYALSEEVLERLRSTADRQEVKLELRGERVTVNGIRQILDEMIYNLVDNGIKYNHPGGRVTVRLWTQAANAILSVEDTGIGIPADSRDRVFERFYRVDKSHSKNTGGTGLGLSIVKHGAVLHDARIELESEEGRGTTIAIVF